MTTTILPVVALLSAAFVAHRRKDHRWIVLVLAVVLLYAAAGEHLPRRADLALRALIPLATSLAYVAVWKAPPWAPWTFGIAWLWPINLICWAPMPDVWWDAASIVPAAMSVIVGLACFLNGAFEKAMTRPRDGIWLPTSVTERVAALWLLGDAIGLIIAWKAPEALALEGQAELGLVTLFQVGWIIRELLKKGSV